MATTGLGPHGASDPDAESSVPLILTVRCGNGPADLLSSPSWHLNTIPLLPQ